VMGRGTGGRTAQQVAPRRESLALRSWREGGRLTDFSGTNMRMETARLAEGAAAPTFWRAFRGGDPWTRTMRPALVARGVLEDVSDADGRPYFEPPSGRMNSGIRLIVDLSPKYKGQVTADSFIQLGARPCLPSIHHAKALPADACSDQNSRMRRKIWPPKLTQNNVFEAVTALMNRPFVKQSTLREGMIIQIIRIGFAVNLTPKLQQKLSDGGSNDDLRICRKLPPFPLASLFLQSPCPFLKGAPSPAPDVVKGRTFERGG